VGKTAPPEVTAPVAPTAEAVQPAPTAPVVVTAPLAASTPQSSLALEFQAASWTRIEDANGRLLVLETVNAGRKLQLQGVAPFKVFLGYAPGVLIYYNGTLFSHADYHRGDLARFRVGSSQDNRPLVR
jgi:cytoskeleton protein RodZ